ncbi:DUF378 domain-containing protein [Ureibacillus sinduriensis]|uniref:DUF378 domain-containing protein n=1 Tax=Ureibacillus sinduriensis TaxID=561440 RepID=UPI00068D3C1D|nr:DUF378 domain-containing protein [Ureibacillus sinduriensis]
MGIIYRIALVLVIIGAINWGLIGLFQFDLVAALFGGQDSALSRIVYSLVGLAGLLSIPLLFKAYDESDVEIANNNHSNAYTNMNYQTEFGEEADFKEVQKNRTTGLDASKNNRATELYNNDGKGNSDKDNLV